MSTEVKVNDAEEFFSILSRFGYLFEQSIPLRGVRYDAPITRVADSMFFLFHCVRYKIGF